MLLRNSLLFSVVVLGVATYPLITEDNFVDRFIGAEPQPASPKFAHLQPVPSNGASGRVVRLRADDRGHYSGEFSINGRKVTAMVDTGASTIAINRSTARRLGMTLTQAQFTQRVATANGETYAAPITIERVEIGRIEVRNVAAFVLEDAALANTLIGMSFLKDMRMSVADNTLYLRQ